MGRRWRVAPEVGFALFRLRPTPCPSTPFHRKGVDGLLIPLLPPSSGRRWRVAPEVGFTLFAFGQPPALRASPFHGKGVDGLLIPFLPPSFGRRWRAAPEVGFTLSWKEVARSAGGWLHSLSPSANPLPFRRAPSKGRGIVSNDRHLHSQPLPIKKRTPASESANPSSQHQLDGFIVLILAKRRKVNHSRFRIATQKPLPLGKRPPAGR